MIVSGYFTLNIKNGDRSGYWVSPSNPTIIPRIWADLFVNAFNMLEGSNH